MSKPHWIDAPDWAQWLAQDEDGEWFWWQEKPEPAESQKFWWADSGEFGIAGDGNPTLNWRSTLEPRP